MVQSTDSRWPEAPMGPRIASVRRAGGQPSTMIIDELRWSM